MTKLLTHYCLNKVEKLDFVAGFFVVLLNHILILLLDSFQYYLIIYGKQIQKCLPLDFSNLLYTGGLLGAYLEVGKKTQLYCEGIIFAGHLM